MPEELQRLSHRRILVEGKCIPIGDRFSIGLDAFLPVGVGVDRIEAFLSDPCPSAVREGQAVERFGMAGSCLVSRLARSFQVS